MNILIQKLQGQIEDCECCGMYSSDGVFVIIDKVLIWERYSDGHMYGRQSEISILDSIINYVEQTLSEKIKEKMSENYRNDWNEKHPGNGIARTKDSWLEYHKSNLDYLEDCLDSVKKNCNNLPYDEVRKVKMISLWLEDCGVLESDVNITIEYVSFSEYEKDLVLT